MIPFWIIIAGSFLIPFGAILLAARWWDKKIKEMRKNDK